MSPITCEEKLLLPKFREKVEDLLDDDFTRSDEFLVRWIRDRDLNLNAAEMMLRKHFGWREANKIDSILLENGDEFVTSRCPHRMDSIDRKGRLVLEMLAGDWKPQEVIDAGKMDKLHRRVLRMMEEVVMKHKKLKYYNTGEDNLPLAIGVVDLGNLTYRQIATKEVLSSSVHLVKVICDNYPEVLETSYVINAPTFFKIIFKILKAVIPSRYVARTHIYGRNRDEWQPVLFDLISPEQLSERYGGHKKDL